MASDIISLSVFFFVCAFRDPGKLTKILVSEPYSVLNVVNFDQSQSGGRTAAVVTSSTISLSTTRSQQLL